MLIKKIAKTVTILCIVAWVITSCGSVKDVAYLQGMDADKQMQVISNKAQLFESKIKSKDILTVSIGSLDKETVLPFNLPNTYVSATGIVSNGIGYPSYMVNNNGNITLPIIGSVHVAGLSENGAEKMIHDVLIKNYLSEPVSVNVRIINFSISVLGEVNRPGKYIIDNGKVNIFQALSMAGDLTLYGERSNVKLVRETTPGNHEIVVLDLRNMDILSSPYFYLQQGDALYVQPNKARAQSSAISSGTTIWFSVVSVLTSVATLLVSVLRK